MNVNEIYIIAVVFALTAYSIPVYGLTASDYFKFLR